jgi:hypothetical protein
MEIVAGCGEVHSGFTMPDEPADRFSVAGATVNGGALGSLVGAAFDGCRPCQNHWLDVLQEDPITGTRLVEVAAVGVQGAIGGIPEVMHTSSPTSQFTTPFRQLVRAGLDTEDHCEMYELMVMMPVAERRLALNDALDVIAGYLS